MNARMIGRALVAILIAVAVTAPQAAHALVVNAGFDRLNGTDLSTDFQPPSTAVPEPSALILLLSGMVLVAGMRRKFDG